MTANQKPEETRKTFFVDTQGTELTPDQLDQLRKDFEGRLLDLTQPQLTRFAIGSTAYFQPNVEKINVMTDIAQRGDVECKIVGVTFVPGKVLYDIAVADSTSITGYYESHPMRGIDSFFLVSGPRSHEGDPIAKDAEPPSICPH